ncbi:hypothetical protein BDN67DRAFT_645220 [Paxillus ammoniavirescens]|nr:hypothetical protein BDN67DRAFT_645220 [Paxillus ammoniavirescens]
MVHDIIINVAVGVRPSTTLGVLLSPIVIPADRHDRISMNSLQPPCPLSITVLADDLHRSSAGCRTRFLPSTWVNHSHTSGWHSQMR